MRSLPSVFSWVTVGLAIAGCTQQMPAASTTSALTGTTGTNSVQTAPLAAGAGAVAGQINPGTGCGGMSTQVALYLNGNPLYQTSAPPYGNFEIQANPGTYVVVAQSGNGCGIQQTVSVTAGQVSQVSLTLTAGGAGGATSTVPPATGTIPACYYSYYGCTGSYYPGYGTIGIGKPNIYLDGAPGTEVKVAPQIAAASNLLVASPALGPTGWDVKIGADGHSLTSGNASYDFLFYDLRTGADLLTDRLAFCVQGSDLEASLEAYLGDLGFRPTEIRDFSDYWPKRFPAADSYCVYPQENDVADAVVPLQVSPAPARSVRVWFLVIPQKPAPSGSKPGGTTVDVARFLKHGQPSSRETLFARFSRSRPATRSLASDGGIALREWGVALLFE